DGAGLQQEVAITDVAVLVQILRSRCPLHVRVALDVRGDARGDACSRALAFLVVLDVQQSVDRRCEQADAAQAGQPLAHGHVQEAFGRYALEVGRGAPTTVARVLLVDPERDRRAPGVALDAGGDVV